MTEATRTPTASVPPTASEIRPMPDGLDAPRALPAAPAAPASPAAPEAPASPGASSRPRGSGDDLPASRSRRDWERMKGWPEGVPITVGLVREVAFELQRTSVREELMNRLRASKLAPNPMHAGLWVAVVAVVPQSHMLLRFVDHHPGAMVVWLALLLAVTWWALGRMIGSLHGPSLRAGLRRAGIDCCVRCGHLLGGVGPDVTCPECGQAHDQLPLGWGPGPIEPAAGPRR